MTVAVLVLVVVVVVAVVVVVDAVTIIIRTTAAGRVILQISHPRLLLEMPFYGQSLLPS